MTEVKGIGRRIELLVDLRNRIRYRELKEEAEYLKDGNDSLPIEHKQEIQVIFHKSMNLLISSILNNNNNNNNNNNVQPQKVTKVTAHMCNSTNFRLINMA